MDNLTTAELLDKLYDVAGGLQSVDEDDDAEVVYEAIYRLRKLEQELIDERYRHDRVQDFCVAQGEELSRLKEKQHE